MRRRRTINDSNHQETHNKGTDLSKDLLDVSVGGEVDDDVFVRRVAVPVDLTKYRVRPVDVTDSNNVHVHVQLLVDDVAIDSLQPRQRYNQHQQPMT